MYDEKTIVKLVDNWRDRWKSVCESGNKENFSVIVMVQPALGSGEKPLVGFEKRFSNIPDWHKQTLNIMQKMVDSLDSLEACSDTFDYTKILDGVNKPIFVDEIHLSDEGNKIIAREIFNDLIKSEMSNLIVKN